MTDQETAINVKRFECADFRAVLSGFLDGVLDGGMAHEAEVHLNDCADCRIIVESAEAIDSDVRRAGDGLSDWPAALEDRMMTAVLGRPSIRVVAGRRRLIFVAWSGWAAAAVALVAFGLTWNQFDERASSPSDLAASTINDDAADEMPQREELTAVNDMADANDPDELNEGAEFVEVLPPVGAHWVAHGTTLGGDANLEAVDAALTTGNTAGSLLALELPDHPDLWAAIAAIDHETSDEPNLASSNGFPIDDAKGDVRPAEGLNRPSPWVPDVANASFMLVSEDDHPTLAGSVSSDAGDVLHQASVLLAALGQAEDESFGDVRLVQQAMAGDDVLERLADARQQLDSPESVELVDMAWSVLEWTNGQLDQQELGRVRDSIARNDLPRRMERLSDQFWN